MSPAAPALVALGHHCWALRLVAALHASGGAKFVTLAHRTGASRDALVASLRTLQAMGLVRRNAGYGHPMRPEYLVALGAERAAGACHTVAQAIQALPRRSSFDRKWALPVVATLAAGPARFSELCRALPGVTPRALAATLKALRADRAIARAVSQDFPPTCTYRLTPTGRRLAPAVRALGVALRTRSRPGKSDA